VSFQVPSRYFPISGDETTEALVIVNILRGRFEIGISPVGNMSQISVTRINIRLIIINNSVHCIYYNVFLMVLQPPWALASDFQFHDHFYRR
jgi:hypothetical protein